jgi:hypothetical protein
VRQSMLDILNAARADPSIFPDAQHTNPSQGPLKLHDNLNFAAQNQADYCAKLLRDPTSAEAHDQPGFDRIARWKRYVGEGFPIYEAQGATNDLQDYPRGWMTGDTHYRPFWNLDNQIVTHVGFGIAKNLSGRFQLVATLAQIPDRYVEPPGPTVNWKEAYADGSRMFAFLVSIDSTRWTWERDPADGLNASWRVSQALLFTQDHAGCGQGTNALRASGPSRMRLRIPYARRLTEPGPDLTSHYQRTLTAPWSECLAEHW